MLSSLSLFSLPTSLRVLPECQALLCSEHGSCYTWENLERHLSEGHGILRKAKKQIIESLRHQPIANQREEAIVPENGRPPIDGLPVYNGYQCGQCTFMTIGRKELQRHCSKSHKHTSMQAAQFQTVQLQTLWAENKHIRYFEVVSRQLNIYSPTAESITTHLPFNAPPPQAITNEQLKRRFKNAQTKVSERDQKLGEPQHISEVTPWLRATGFYLHVADIDLKTLPASYAVPKGEDDPQLSTILESVARILRKSMQALSDDRGTDSRRINRHNAKILNTFRPSETSQRPLSRLQNAKSLGKYILTWQNLVCYYFRVTTGEALRDDIFVATDEQNECLVAVLAEISAQQQAAESSPAGRGRQSRARHSLVPSDSEFEPSSDSNEDEEKEAKARQARLDKLVLAFCVALIQQPLPERTFDSAIISFAAVLAWDADQQAWMKISNYSSYLSCLIYDCQLFAVQHCLNAFDHGLIDDLTQCISSFCRKWILNDSQGPVAELLSFRLLAFAIGKTTVNQAQIRWHEDGETLVYNDLRYSLSDLRSEIRHSIESARRIMKEDLCFGLKEVPTFDLSKIQDNWDASKAGASFVTDTRNADLFEDLAGWIIDHLLKDPEKAALFFQMNSNGQWIVKSDAAKQYLCSVQAFLRPMSIGMLKGSGQPPRIEEFLGLRVSNTLFDKRGLFMHNGWMLFILTYHKSIGRTNASRWPVRVLLPEVAQLLAQYLVVVVPFLRFLSVEVRVPEEVSPYLWSHGKEVWSSNKMSQVLKSGSEAAIGVKISGRAWRQIAVGIALKKFAGTAYQTELDIHGDEDEEEGEDPHLDAGSMPNVFHYQAAHTPRTGNQVYGGTINFREGLTDAGLQEYLRASQMWHQLCRDPVQTSYRPAPLGTSSSSFSSRPGHRRMLSSAETPLPKRIALGQAPLRHHRRWPAEEGFRALQRLYGEKARFRSPAQEKLIQTILSGAGQVIGILSTGEGKSLSFLLPPQLPGAGTTVVIVPLVALKQDLIRRCQEQDVEHHVWSKASTSEEVGCPLILVSMEQAAAKPFKRLLLRLDMSNSLDRVVFDEGHLVMTASSYRPRFEFLKSLRELRCQFVFLTATMPPTMMATFQQKLLLVEPQVIRSQTIRKDLTYYVTRSTHPDLLAYSTDMVQKFLRGPWMVDEERARVIVYTSTRRAVDVLAEALDGLAYYSDSGTMKEKGEQLQRWVDGCQRVMVATSAFGPGVDYPCVRAVFHVGMPDNAIDFAQEVGRAGRDGEGGVSSVFLRPGEKMEGGQRSEELLPPEVQVMRRYLDEPRCRAAVLSGYLDQVRWYCEDLETCCDRCQTQGLYQGEQQEFPPGWKEGKMTGDERVKRSKGDIEEGGAEGEEEEDSERLSSSEVEDLEVGARKLRQHVRDQGRGLQRYIQGLERLQGRCVICWLDREGGWSDVRDMRGIGEVGVLHSLDECRNVQKYRFFDAKREARTAGRRGFEGKGERRQGWLVDFAACFRCGNPQAICPEQGRKGCQHRDMVFPASWAVFQWEWWRKRELSELAERVFRDEEEYMLWLGEGQIVYGIEASNAMMVTDWVIRNCVE